MNLFKKKRSFKEVEINLNDYNDKEIDFENISSFSDHSEKNLNYIDDLAFSDLNGTELFKFLDNCYSSAGEEYLYYSLRRPLVDNKEIEKRRGLLDYFHSNKDLKESLSNLLYKLGKTRDNSKYILFKDIFDSNLLRILCIIAAILPTLSIVLALLLKSMGFAIFAIFTFAFNGYLNLKVEKILDGSSGIVGYFSYMLTVSEKIIKLKDATLLKTYPNLKNLITTCSKIKRSGAVISITRGSNEIVSMFNFLFLMQANFYFKLVTELKKHKESLRELYATVGEIDMLIAIVNLRENLETYSEPRFIHDKHIKIVDGYHPLLRKPISNSIEIDNNGVLITGSNMSGKSTFLRTIGVNVLCAQTILTAFCSDYSAPLFYISTSISPEDNITKGKSYYLSEAEAMLNIIKRSDYEVPNLCLIDEIFRGTNPIERISAASNICQHLISHNAIPIVATHDLELTKLVKNYKYYYFKEDVDDKGLIFDYKLREGISPTRNAIKLLRFLGYPSEIIDKTEDDISKIG